MQTSNSIPVMIIMQSLSDSTKCNMYIDHNSHNFMDKATGYGEHKIPQLITMLAHMLVT